MGEALVLLLGLGSALTGYLLGAIFFGDEINLN